MKKLILAGIMAGLLSAAQPAITISVTPASVQPGGSAVVTYSYTDSSPSANMWGLLVQPGAIGANAGTPVIGAASTAAAKELTCGAVASNPSVPPVCIIATSASPLSVSTAISSGVLFTLPVLVPASALPENITFNLPVLSAIDVNGKAITLSSNSASLSVVAPPSIYDLNGDGVVNGLDVTIGVNMAIAVKLTGPSACTGPFAAVGDTQCGMFDVFMVVGAALGLH